MLEQLRVAQQRLHEIIPGGVHTCARGSDKFLTPVIVRGHGTRVEDVSSNWLVDEDRGRRPVTLGGCDRPVVSTVRGAGTAQVYHYTVEAGVTHELMKGRPVALAMRVCRVASAEAGLRPIGEDSDR